MATKINSSYAWLVLAEERLTVVKLLLAEKFFDDAISRAYYSMFSAAKAALLSAGVETRSHSGLINKFGQHFVNTNLVDAQLAKALTAAFAAHQDSDYGIFSRSPQSKAEAIVDNADQFLATITELLSESNDT